MKVTVAAYFMHTLRARMKLAGGEVFVNAAPVRHHSFCLNANATKDGGKPECYELAVSRGCEQPVACTRRGRR